MTNVMVQTPVEIMGKIYHVKCAAEEKPQLQRAAKHLSEQMRFIQEHGRELSVDRIAVITALNVVHHLFHSEQQKNQDIEGLQQKLAELRDKIDDILGVSGANAILMQCDALS